MANIALLGWPFVSAFLFRFLEFRAAIVATLIGGYLLLPPVTGINIPMLPRIDKEMVAALSALLLAAILMGRMGRPDQILPGWLPKSKTALLLIGRLIIGTCLTVLTNGDRVAYGTRSLPGLRLYDAFSMTQGILVAIVPFFLARKFLADDAGHRVLLVGLCIAGVLYSLPTLYEVRMSPQLNRDIYGFAAHGWRMNLRGGGFRPVVFLSHGLLLGIFLCCALLAAAACFRDRLSQRPGLFLLAAIWLFLTLFLAKTLGAFLIALMLLPVILFLNVRLQLLVAASLSAMILLYPMLRGADLVPTGAIVSFAERIDPQRAASLAFRLDNEDRLLDKANQRPLFGWGGWGRSRVFDENGNDISVTDGRWTIVLGLGGWARYIGEFGLLTLSIILLTLRSRTMPLTFATSGLALVLVANLIDMIPNSGISPVTWLLAGALFGRLEVATARSPATASGTVERSEPMRGRPPQPAAASLAAGEAESDAEPSGTPISAYTRQTTPHRRPGSLSILPGDR